MARTVTVETEPPPYVRKSRAITPSVEVRIEFDRGDLMIQKLHEIFATAYLYGSDGRVVESASLKYGVGEKGGLVMGNNEKPYVNFSFSGLRIDDAGGFFLRIQVYTLNLAEGSKPLETVDTEDFVVYDAGQA